MRWLPFQLRPDVPPEGVLGILTISLIPGGPLANIVAVLIGANSELNVVLTSTEMLLCTVMLPIGLLWVYPHTFSTQQVIKVPYTEMLYGMMLVLPPLLLGLVLGEGVVRHTEPATHAWHRRRVFQLIILIAAIAYVADRQLEPDRQEASILSQIPDILQAGSVPPATAVAAVAVGRPRARTAHPPTRLTAPRPSIVRRLATSARSRATSRGASRRISRRCARRGGSGASETASGSRGSWQARSAGVPRTSRGCSAPCGLSRAWGGAGASTNYSGKIFSPVIDFGGHRY